MTIIQDQASRAYEQLALTRVELAAAALADIVVLHATYLPSTAWWMQVWLSIPEQRRASEVIVTRLNSLPEHEVAAWAALLLDDSLMPWGPSHATAQPHSLSVCSITADAPCRYEI